jgi:putative transposase
MHQQKEYLMPRKPRFFVPGVAAHIVQRGHARDPVFFENCDYQTYLGLLHDASLRHQCDIHAYVLMTNHIHLLVTPGDTDGISRLMQAVNRLYVPYFNFTYGASGSIWEGRFKASLINDEQYLLTCMRYIELNPVRANMVHLPEEYRWSSYLRNAHGDINELITPHRIYKKLGSRMEERLAVYKSLFKSHINLNVIADIRKSCQTGTPLGNDRFRVKIEQQLNCKVGHARRGRPSKWF